MRVGSLRKRGVVAVIEERQAAVGVPEEMSRDEFRKALKKILIRPRKMKITAM